MSEPIITVYGLSKQYRMGTGPGPSAIWSRIPQRFLKGFRSTAKRSNSGTANNELFWALKDINFDVAKGERIGIIGRNGAGKSTLLKILSRVTYPTEGEVRIRGRVTSLLEVGTGFNDNLTGRENIYLNASLHGLDRREINEKLGEIIEFSGVGRFIDTPVKHYSSGMRVRLAFSVAAHLEPDILILDEILAVGDLAFQQKCLNRVQGLVSEGRTILFASHSMGDVARFCDKVIWLDNGSIKFIGDTLTGVNLYQETVEKAEKREVQRVVRILSQMLEQALVDHYDLIQHFESIFREFRSRESLLLFVRLSRWLGNQPEEFRLHLKELSERGGLDVTFMTLLKELGTEVMTTEGENQARKREVRRVVKVLSRTLEEALTEHYDLTPSTESIFREFRSRESLLLFVHFSKWLENQPEEFRLRLRGLFDKGALGNAFVSFLRGWGSQLTLEYAQSQSFIRELYLAELFPNIGSVRVPVGIVHEESHHPNKVDMVYVCAMAAAMGAKNIFEFGTYRGQTTCGLASIADDVTVWTLNLPPEADERYGQYIDQFIKDSPYRTRIKQIFHDSRTFDTAPYAHTMDFIFIDADHSYAAVKNDTEKALEMLRPGGAIVWHDYAAKSPSVFHFIQEFSKSHPVFRIKNTCLVVYLDGVDVYKFVPVPIARSLEDEESNRFFVDQYPR